MTQEHTVDVVQNAKRINVAPGALQAILDQLPENIGVAEFYSYNNAFGIVRLVEPITMQNADPEPYALVSFSGYVFPFHPNDIENIEAQIEKSDHNFDREVSWKDV